MRLPGFRHYNTKKQKYPTTTRYYGILLDSFKNCKYCKRHYTLDIYLGHHIFVMFWGNRD